MSYQPKNYKSEGGDLQAIGGELRVLTGGKVTPNSGTQAEAIADVDTGASATAAANATAINGILAALRAVGVIAAE